MAIPPTADELVAALKAEGLTVIEYKSWRTHNRNHKGAWGPVNGVMLHHTASRGSTPQEEADSVSLCYYGHSTLPGPLCQAVIAKSGRVYLTGNGRCNHAGGGDPNVLQAVIDERYGDRPPVPRTHDGGAGAVDGNARFIGAECINLGDGKDPWPPAQVEAMVRFSAAICRLKGWTAKSTIAHREWSDWKPDPAGPGMPAMPELRTRIAARLSHSASWTGDRPAPETPLPDYGNEDPMSIPNLSALARTEDLILFKDTPQTIYWTGEHTDEGNEHGVGGKTVLDGGKYTATLNLHFTGLGENETVRLYPVEEDGSGNYAGQGETHEIEGRGNPALPVKFNATITGRVYNRLSFQLVSDSDATVTLTNATLSMLSWPA